ncbi:hypothetical protein HMPREF1531_02535 [Propionibacterium sp. oral taxon 192 str. F0372]|uniref:Fur family transcriptional regulator n=1 Tax=Propionibacterium sp. oral taxon 192 TaxID=671222 RepID=UPI0003547322|nr:Fur family transcriptional regulator [Propionibacterium sp. oral taxon 192]EPH00423.1 hypothetical protein HMPREF1531_02535 [Propionibacterium sp. oral taxon 192 str. F0372]
MSTDQTGKHLRLTRQRQVILDHMNDTNEFVSAQKAHAQLKMAGESVGLATVYRGLQWLAGEGLVDAIRMVDGEIGYRRCSTEHHHHLICRTCGRAVEILPEALERWAIQVATEHGFHEPEHHVEVYGVCDACWSAMTD